MKRLISFEEISEILGMSKEEVSECIVSLLEKGYVVGSKNSDDTFNLDVNWDKVRG